MTSELRPSLPPGELSALRTVRLKNALADSEVEARRIAGIREASKDPGLRKFRIANLRKASRDPEIIARRIAGSKTPKARALKSAGMTKYWQRMPAEERARRVAAIQKMARDPKIRLKEAHR